MDLAKLLNDFGLTNTEANIYLSALRLGNASASELAKDTGYKRPAVYHALETLESKGLMKILGTRKILQYSPEPPEQLKSLLNRKRIELNRLEKAIDTSLPLFLNIEPMAKEKIGVDFFRGIEAIKNLAEKTLNNESCEILAIIPSFDVFADAFGRDYMMYYLREKKKRGITSRSIWAGHINEEKYDAELAKHSEYLRDVRFTPQRFAGNYPSIILIWDNNVAIINASSEVFGILITSQDYVATMKLLWVSLWEICSNQELSL